MVFLHDIEKVFVIDYLVVDFGFWGVEGVVEVEGFDFEEGVLFLRGGDREFERGF